MILGAFVTACSPLAVILDDMEIAVAPTEPAATIQPPMTRLGGGGFTFDLEEWRRRKKRHEELYALVLLLDESCET